MNNSRLFVWDPASRLMTHKVMIIMINNDDNDCFRFSYELRQWATFSLWNILVLHAK